MESSIAELLVGAGYRRLEDGLAVPGLKLPFHTAFHGGGHLGGLVLVYALARGSQQELIRSARALRTYATHVGSTLPTSLVVIGEPLPETRVELERLFRLLVLDDTTFKKKEVEKALAGLLPVSFSLPAAPSGLSDPSGLIRHALDSLGADPTTERLITAAGESAEQVKDVLRETVEEALEGAGGKQA